MSHPMTRQFNSDQKFRKRILRIIIRVNPCLSVAKFPRSLDPSRVSSSAALGDICGQFFSSPLFSRFQLSARGARAAGRRRDNPHFPAPSPAPLCTDLSPFVTFVPFCSNRICTRQDKPRDSVVVEQRQRQVQQFHVTQPLCLPDQKNVMV